jgi:hypothetical protein
MSSTSFVDLAALRAFPWEDDLEPDRWVVPQKGVVAMSIFREFDGTAERPPKRPEMWRPQGMQSGRRCATPLKTPVRGGYYTQSQRPFLRRPTTPGFERTDMRGAPGAGHDDCGAAAFALHEIEVVVLGASGEVLETIVLMGLDLMVMEDCTDVILAVEEHCDLESFSAERRAEVFARDLTELKKLKSYTAKHAAQRGSDAHDVGASGMGGDAPSTMFVRNFVVEVHPDARAVVFAAVQPAPGSGTFGVFAKDDAEVAGDGGTTLVYASSEARRLDHFAEERVFELHNAGAHASGSSTVFALYEGVESEGGSVRFTEDESYRIEVVVDRLPANAVLRARRAEEATHEAHHREQRGRVGEQRRSMLSAIDDAILMQCCADSSAQRETETFGKLHGARVVRVCVRLALVCALFLVGLPLGAAGAAATSAPSAPPSSGDAYATLDFVGRFAVVAFVDYTGVLARGIVRAALYSAVASDSALFVARTFAPSFYAMLSCPNAVASAAVASGAALPAAVCAVAGGAALVHRAVLLTTALVVFTGPEVRAEEKTHTAGAARSGTANLARVARRAAKLKEQLARDAFVRTTEWGGGRLPPFSDPAVAKVWEECVSDSCYF